MAAADLQPRLRLHGLPPEALALEITESALMKNRALAMKTLDALAAAGLEVDEALVLATGGLGHAYPTTTNPEGVSGDGLARALLAGAERGDLAEVGEQVVGLVEREHDADPAGVHPDAEAAFLVADGDGAGRPLGTASGHGGG